MIYLKVTIGGHVSAVTNPAIWEPQYVSMGVLDGDSLFSILK